MKPAAAPYIYDNMTKGFEVELAEFLAKELGRTSKPFSGEWTNLPELLAKSKDDKQAIDIVLNGYEYGTDFREQASIPYYIYRLALVVNKEDEEVRSWDDLRKRRPDGSKRSVVVLTGSAAQRYLTKKFGNDIKLVISNDVSNAFDLVAQKHDADATVQDNPAATYYVGLDQDRLKRVGEGRAPNFYVILTRKNDAELRRQLDEALRKGIRNGTLEAIYRKYHIWNDDQQRLLYWASQPWPPTEPLDADEEGDVASERPQVDWGQALSLLGKGALTTVGLVISAFPLALLAGLVVALVRLYGPGWLAGMARLYVELIRGTPLLLQLFVIFYVLPQVTPISLSSIQAGIVGLALNYSAYEAENLRAGFQSIPRGQMEAALALGMSPAQGIRHILLPQAFRVVIPPITNDIIAMFKDSSICSAILITELTRQYNVLYNNHREHIVIFAIVTAALYLLMSYPLSLLARYLERRFAKQKS